MAHHYTGGSPHRSGTHGLAARPSRGYSPSSAQPRSPQVHHLKHKQPHRLAMEGLKSENRDVLLTPATPVDVRKSRVFSPHAHILPKTPVRKLSLAGVLDDTSAAGMGHVLCNIFLFSSRKNTPVDPVPGVAYYDSGREQQGYKRFLNQFLRERGVQPVLSNKGPSKLKDSLRQLEELLFAHRPLTAQWTSPNSVRLILDDGTFADIHVSHASSELVRVTLDQSLKKGLGHFATTATSLRNVFVMGLENQHVALVRINEVHSKKQDKLKLKKKSTLHLSQQPSPIISLSLSCRGSLAAAVVDARNDSRTPSQRQLTIFTLETPDTGCEVVCTLPILCDQLLCQFSRQQPRILYTLEYTQQPHRTLCLGTYEYSGGELVMLTSSNLTVTASVTAFDRNFAESKLAVGCEDGSLFIFDEATQTSQPATLDVKQPVTCLRWHREDAVLLAAFGNGDICFFDHTLSLLSVQLPFTAPSKSINILSHVNFQARVQLLEWASSSQGSSSIESPTGQSHENVMVIFDRGPVVLVRVELGVLTHAHARPHDVILQTIANGDLNTGLAIARSLNDTDEFHRALCLTVHYLLMQDTAHAYDLAHSILDTFRNDMMSSEDPKHGERLFKSWSRLYTILFYRMIKMCQYEIAFTIANILNDGRLFAQLASVTRKRGETAISHIVQRKAEALLGPSDAAAVRVPVAVLDGLTEEMSQLANDDRADLSARDVVRLGLWLEGQGRLREAMDIYRFHDRPAELERVRTMQQALYDDPDGYERNVTLDRLDGTSHTRARYDDRWT